jgi:hypothetical protein
VYADWMNERALVMASTRHVCVPRHAGILSDASRASCIGLMTGGTRVLKKTKKCGGTRWAHSSDETSESDALAHQSLTDHSLPKNQK